MKYFVPALLLMSSLAVAQGKPPAVPPKITYLRCGTLYDGKSEAAQKNVTMRVVGEKIETVGAATPEAGAELIDLSREVLRQPNYSACETKLARWKPASSLTLSPYQAIL